MRTIVTALDIMNDRDSIAKAIDRLWRKSGGTQVANSVITQRYLIDRDAAQLSVSFKSSAWTGR